MKWFLYRMDWNPQKGKYDKAPCTMDGQRWPVAIESVWTADRAQVERCLDSMPQQGAACYWLGMKAEPEDHLFFIDMDHCVVDGQLDATAATLAHPFLAAGAYFEATSSGQGVHIIGRYTGALPPHDHKRPNVHTYEFYTTTQGVALNRAANQGSMDVDCTSILYTTLETWFPPRVTEAEMFEVKPSGPRDDWDGPTDDDELIAKALAARGSAGVAFGTQLSFGQLWRGECEKNNETDMALASHLAFWTGCDVDRVIRLMRRSGLAREKWDSHHTYLRELTVMRACTTTKNVYKQMRVVIPQIVQQIKESDVDWYKVTSDLIDRIHATADLRDLVEDLMPSIGSMGIPQAYSDRVVQALSKRLALFDNKISVTKLRALVSPPKVSAIADNVVIPDWAAALCYVMRGDKFMDTSTGSMMSADGLRMLHASKMPFKNTGDREDVVKYARERWNIPVVDDVLYRPDQPVYFEHGGMKYANLFLPNSMPAITAPSVECVECITLFQQHLWLLCSQRKEVYMALLLWIAHNVQFPGRKIRWAPLLKGVQGDGKSIVLDLLIAVMGFANVKLTSPATLSNSGGFTDWAMGKAVNLIEEIRLQGKEKERLFNAMKIFIGDTAMDLNRKGKASEGSLVNITNHWANTNYEDGIPIDNFDRRWMIVFSPFMSIEEAVQAKGLQTVEDLVRQFKRMGTSMRQEPGAWRGWLMGADLSGFDPDARAPHTDERAIMSSLSEEPIEQMVREVIEQGCPGVTTDVFSSSMLRRALKIRAQLEDLQLPSSSAWHSLLTKIGYRPWIRPVKIGSQTQRLWIRKNFHGDQENLAEILKGTMPTCNL